MKKIFYSLSTVVLALGCLIGCSETPAPFITEIPVRSISAPIKSATATVGNVTVEGKVDNSANTITFMFQDPNTDLTAVEVNMELVTRALPAAGAFKDTVLNLTEPYSFYVNNLEVDMLYSIIIALPSFERIPSARCSAINCQGDGPWMAESSQRPDNPEKALFDGNVMPGFKLYSGHGYKFFGWAQNTPTPWFTFDVGEKCVLYQIHIIPYYGWIAYDPCIFEIWAYQGTGNVPATTPADWKNDGAWIKIADGDFSEQLVLAEKVESGEVTAGSADDPVKNGATLVIANSLPEGHSFTSIPAARYYRFVVVESQAGHWKDRALAFTGNGCGAGWTERATALCISEMELWKYIN